MSSGAADNSRHDPYAALRVRDYQLFLPGNTLANLGMRMQSAAVYWEIYERTGSALYLGYVGLVQILPVILLALPAGHAADRFSRKRILMIAEVVIALCSAGLAINSVWGHSVQAIYGLLLLTGVARAFQQPARSAFVPLIVPRAIFSNAVMWNTSAFQVSSILGPACGGLLISLTGDATIVYVGDALFALTFFATVSMIRGARQVVHADEAPSVRSLLAGATFVYRHKVVLGALTLDLFAVLLGGAVALLPIYAKDILRVGAWGYGLLEAAPSVGALLMSFVLAHLPPLRRAGRALLWCVVGFGIATIVFGFSRNFALSMFMLFLTGVFDTVSVVVRHTLVQLLTPDEMRGRVSAVNGLFIGISNEMGGFESGLVAQFFGPVASVVSGGVGTIVVVAAAAFLWPELRRVGKLSEVAPVATASGGAFPVVETSLGAGAENERTPDTA